MLGIIILNYQTWEISIRCMESIKDTIGEIPYHIYLVDNASPILMPEICQNYLAKHRETVSFLQAAENRGYAAGNNIGIRQALVDNCEFILLTNNDIVFTSESISNMLVAFKSRKVGIVGPKVLNTDGNIQVSRCAMKTEMREIFQVFTVAKKVFRRKYRRYYCLDQKIDKPSVVYYVSGCCFMMSRVCAEAVTPLDEGTILYDEEPILGIHMEEKGFQTLYYPDSVVIHRHGATIMQIQPFMYQCICQSELYYCSHYLHAKKWQLWLLYHYRRTLYRIRSRKDEKLKEYWDEFDRQTKNAYQKAIGEAEK
ncbi:glycosyltransferase [Roseburia sp. BX1005]|uniref:Glycosyltransferase n=1 Tax=Roseburia zhanii TaxID=2763064 RepID=A0A923LLE2_9FIRM|nr:glycosyltransferase [Roseburia zhanii]MBC5712803.1 glycosyltransferase [Roseburia zhanii]